MPLWSYLPSHMNVSFPPEGAKAPRLPAAAGIVQAPGISAGQDGQASGLVPEQPLPAKARRSIDMREIHVVQPVACRFELPVAAAAPRPRSAGTARAATRTAADVTDQDESAFVAQRTESDADRRPNDQSSSEMRRTRRRNCLPNCSCTRARTKCGACEPWNGSALHRDHCARTVPTARTAGTSCIALSGIELCKRLLNGYQHCIASLRQLGHGTPFIGLRKPLFEQLCVRVVELR